MTSVNHVFGQSIKIAQKTTQTQKGQHAEWIFIENIYEDEFNFLFPHQNQHYYIENKERGGNFFVVIAYKRMISNKSSHKISCGSPKSLFFTLNIFAQTYRVWFINIPHMIVLAVI